MSLKRGFFVFLFISLFHQMAIADEWWQKIEADWKPSVVSIETTWKYYLNGEELIGSIEATGFVVDAENGYIVTNAHVAGTSPGQYRISMYNDESIKAKLKYVDPWHDFAILKFNPADLSFKAKAVILGSHSELKAGEQLVLIGNSSGEGLSTKIGNISKLFVNRASNTMGRYSHYIHTSLPRAGGASGAPLWNQSGHVVGLHAAGNEQESFELRIDYIVDAIRQIQSGQYPSRGDLFISLNTVTWSDAEKWLLYPKSYVDSAPKENADLHYALVVGSTLAGSKASEFLKQGDVIVAFKLASGEYQKIGYSLYDFDSYVNHNVGENIALQIFRRVGDSTTLFDVTLPVSDANNSFAKTFCTFAGATFQNVTPSLAMTFGIDQKGVFITEAAPGTTFYNVGSDVNKRQGKKAAVIKEINSSSIDNLEMFTKKIFGIPNEAKFTATVCNLMNVSRDTDCQFLEMALDDGEKIQTYAWSPTTLNWETVH